MTGTHGCGYFNFLLNSEKQISSAGSFITSRATLYFLVALCTNVTFFYEADASNEIMSAQVRVKQKPGPCLKFCLPFSHNILVDDQSAEALPVH